MKKLFIPLLALALLPGCASEIKRDAMAAQMALATAQANALRNPLVRMEFDDAGRPKNLIVGQPVGNQNLAAQIQAPKSDVAEALHEVGNILNLPFLNVLSGGWAAKSLAGAVKSSQTTTLTADDHSARTTTDIRATTDNHTVTDNHMSVQPAAAPAK